ncbi:Uncharacterised protein [Klebsiella aerogenes]|nr:Uncharacterised protein [Klebsiella aerogenes]
MTFLDRVGRVHYVKHQMGFTNVLFCDVFVLFYGMVIVVYLFFETEKPRSVDQDEILTNVVHLHFIG